MFFFLKVLRVKVYAYMKGWQTCLSVYFLPLFGNFFGGRNEVNMCLFGCVVMSHKEGELKKPFI